MIGKEDIPSYSELMLPIVRAVAALGGSGRGTEITARAMADGGFSEEQLALTYPGRDRGVLADRFDWALSYCKLSGVLDRPKRGLYLLNDMGQSILAMPEADAVQTLQEADRVVRASRRKPKKANDGVDGVPLAKGDLDDSDDESIPDDDEYAGRWKEELLHRLHQLSPDAFERFALFLLRSYDMELEPMGGPGDEGIDGIGTARITSVLSRTVAVQAKRYEPAKTVGREVVALFQSDAIAAGAEHGVLITTARFSAPARKAALGRHPTIDLIDGDRLAELALEQSIGISSQPVVQLDWFDRFER